MRRDTVAMAVLAVGTSVTVMTYAPSPMVGFGVCATLGFVLGWRWR